MDKLKKYAKWAAVAALALIAGCAGMQQAVQAYGSVAVGNAKAMNDTLIEAYKVGICGLPLAAIARHPEMIPSVRSLCVNPNDKVTEQLLDAVERQAAFIKVKP